MRRQGEVDKTVLLDVCDLLLSIEMGEDDVSALAADSFLFRRLCVGGRLLAARQSAHL